MLDNMMDILFVLGMMGFLLATLRQLRKVLRTKQTAGISLTHYKWKLMAIVFMTAGYSLSFLTATPLLLSLITSCFEFILNVTLVHYVIKYRRHPL